jgi:hypothetical protein
LNSRFYGIDLPASANDETHSLIKKIEKRKLNCFDIHFYKHKSPVLRMYQPTENISSTISEFLGKIDAPQIYDISGKKSLNIVKEEEACR